MSHVKYDLNVFENDTTWANSYY